MEKNYAPYTEGEFNTIKSEMEKIGIYLPTDKMSWMWSICTTIRGNTREPQPCSCKSSSGLWAGCANTIREYIKRVEG